MRLRFSDGGFPIDFGSEFDARGLLKSIRVSDVGWQSIRVNVVGRVALFRAELAVSGSRFDRYCSAFSGLELLANPGPWLATDGLLWPENVGSSGNWRLLVGTSLE